LTVEENAGRLENYRFKMDHEYQDTYLLGNTCEMILGRPGRPLVRISVIFVALLLVVLVRLDLGECLGHPGLNVPPI
jgi:hypothetical protein